MSEIVAYEGRIIARDEESAEKIAEAVEKLEFGEVQTQGREVRFDKPDGWRGAGKSCKEILKETIGEALDPFRSEIDEAHFRATHVEDAPFEIFSLDDLIR